MTFVVGQITPRDPHLAADTLLTFADSGTSNLFKLVILDATTVVGYAGYLAQAVCAIRAISHLRCDSDRLDALVQATQSADVQFLLGSARRRSIARIRKGAWEER